MTHIDSTVIDTPAGPLSILAGPDGAVRAAGFTADPAALLPLIHPSLRGAAAARGRPRPGDRGRPRPTWTVT